MLARTIADGVSFLSLYVLGFYKEAMLYNVPIYFYILSVSTYEIITLVSPLEAVWGGPDSCTP